MEPRAAFVSGRRDSTFHELNAALPDAFLDEMTRRWREFTIRAGRPIANIIGPAWQQRSSVRYCGLEADGTKMLGQWHCS